MRRPALKKTVNRPGHELLNARIVAWNDELVRLWKAYQEEKHVYASQQRLLAIVRDKLIVHVKGV